MNLKIKKITICWFLAHSAEKEWSKDFLQYGEESGRRPFSPELMAGHAKNENRKKNCYFPATLSAPPLLGRPASSSFI
jgi:hypothetical protein